MPIGLFGAVTGPAFLEDIESLTGSTQEYSGVALTQNASPANTTAVAGGQIWQEFYLPTNYARGDGQVPPLTGVQVFVNVTDGRALTATLDWTIDHFDGTNWIRLASGTTIGCQADGDEIGFDIFFDTPVPIQPTWLQDRFRFSVAGRSTTLTTLGEPVLYDGKTAIVEGVSYAAQLNTMVPFPLTVNGTPGVLYLDNSGAVTYSVQQGVAEIWYSTPNPLAQQECFAYTTLGAILDNNQQVSLMFTLYSWTADSGVDFLGNQYRSRVINESIANVTTTDGALGNAFWLSKPNPSQFAVECLYFDIRQGEDPVVIDRILLDPMTPNVYFSVYYSSDGDPGTSEWDWQTKLWTRVPQTFALKRRETFALPQPITAKYICIEFSMLQPKYYAPGNFQKPITYKKFPKWVLDYFLARTAIDEDSEPFIANQVEVQYNALDLAYNYYLDDLHQQPTGPEALGLTLSTDLNNFLINRTDISDQVDPYTLAQINTIYSSYQQDPALRGNNKFILSDFAAQVAMNGTSLGTQPAQFPASTPEQIFIPDPPDPGVSTLDRYSIIYEQTMPVMFFYVDCRHVYRELQATFTNDRGYFVGIRELAFFRDQYATVSDTPLYVESAGDFVNCERNDFAIVNGVLRTYSDTS